MATQDTQISMTTPLSTLLIIDRNPYDLKKHYDTYTALGYRVVGALFQDAAQLYREQDAIQAFGRAITLYGIRTEAHLATLLSHIEPDAVMVTGSRAGTEFADTLGVMQAAQRIRPQSTYVNSLPVADTMNFIYRKHGYATVSRADIPAPVISDYIKHQIAARQQVQA